MSYREFDLDRDLKAVDRIWRECGWIDNDKQAAFLKDFFSVGDALVGTIDNEAECAVHSTPGRIMYQDQELVLGAVTAVTTSRIARKSGFARELTARLLARQASAGMQVSALGMFEQGFYDKVGYGTGSYEHWITFDPATLNVDRTFRPPKRLTPDDFEAVHKAMCARKKGHGGCDLDPARIVKAELNWAENCFGFGYYDGPGGELSHFVFGSAKGENGPYNIHLRAYQNSDQLLELLALIKSLGDQVNSIGMLEIGDIQLQDLLHQPFRNRRSTARSEHENRSRAMAYWQLRILDLAACMSKTNLQTPPVQFNLSLTDPVTNSLDEGVNWQGIGGDYIVELGQESHAEIGFSDSLPTLAASVNAFSRMWFGIRPASSLAVTDNLQGSAELLKSLDESLRLPTAHLGWDF
jgi:predicted acetyltransferase